MQYVDIFHAKISACMSLFQRRLERSSASVFHGVDDSPQRSVGDDSAVPQHFSCHGAGVVAVQPAHDLHTLVGEAVCQHHRVLHYLLRGQILSP